MYCRRSYCFLEHFSFVWSNHDRGKRRCFAAVWTLSLCETGIRRSHHIQVWIHYFRYIHYFHQLHHLMILLKYQRTTNNQQLITNNQKLTTTTLTSYLQDVNGGRSSEDVGMVCINLADFVGSRSSSRKFLLQEARVNSVLRVRLKIFSKSIIKHWWFLYIRIFNRLQ